MRYRSPSCLSVDCHSCFFILVSPQVFCIPSRPLSILHSKLPVPPFVFLTPLLVLIPLPVCNLYLIQWPPVMHFISPLGLVIPLPVLLLIHPLMFLVLHTSCILVPLLLLIFLLHTICAQCRLSESFTCPGHHNEGTLTLAHLSCRTLSRIHDILSEEVKGKRIWMCVCL